MTSGSNEPTKVLPPDARHAALMERIAKAAEGTVPTGKVACRGDGRAALRRATLPYRLNTRRINKRVIKRRWLRTRRYKCMPMPKLPRDGIAAV